MILRHPSTCSCCGKLVSHQKPASIGTPPPQDLLEATRKAFAAGMGEWDLQALEWGAPRFRERLLQGPIGWGNCWMMILMALLPWCAVIRCPRSRSCSDAA